MRILSKHAQLCDCNVRCFGSCGQQHVGNGRAVRRDRGPMPTAKPCSGRRRGRNPHCATHIHQRAGQLEDHLLHTHTPRPHTHPYLLAVIVRVPRAVHGHDHSRVVGVGAQRAVAACAAQVRRVVEVVVAGAAGEALVQRGGQVLADHAGPHVDGHLRGRTKPGSQGASWRALAGPERFSKARIKPVRQAGQWQAGATTHGPPSEL